MNTATQTEFVRLVDNKPLTLACSALADFLWEDFVRSARPSVNYLIDHYNIRQLSRFGKELFDRLYNADNVTWLVTEDAYEEYFRKVCDGDAAAMPEGYKPEDAIWHAIMADLSNTAAWPTLLQHCVGEQFNSGNNAISILNKLSEAIEEAIHTMTFDVKLLTGASEELNKLREQCKKALEDDDRTAAGKARSQGKQINQKINEAVQAAMNTLKAHTNDIVDEVLKESQQKNDALSTLCGVLPGQGSRTMDLKEKQELARRLENNKKLKELAKKLGALRQIWNERKRAKKSKASYEAVVGAEFSDNLTRAFPAELALAGTDKGKALFALKYSHKTLLTKNYDAACKNLGKGPVVMYVDVSGSMSGEKELWSKAIALVVAESALKENRTVYINLFDTRIDQSLKIDSKTTARRDVLDFMAEWTLGGGTSFNAVLAHAADKGCFDDRTDVLMITDGHADVNDSVVKRLNAFKQATGTQWSTVCVESEVSDTCHKFSDEVYAVSLYSLDNTIDVIQRCVR
jgi:uncharacterized protein with von Willebrand factor type A (vWA) domain